MSIKTTKSAEGGYMSISFPALMKGLDSGNIYMMTSFKTGTALYLGKHTSYTVGEYIECLEIARMELYHGTITLNNINGGKK